MAPKHLALIAGLIAGTALPGSPASAAQRVSITGEIIDTWCYLSGVMGGPDAVVGSAHHTCAIWCAAGGIPVGVLTDDGTVYMVLKLPDEDSATGGDSFLRIQSDRITADGTAYQRDGVNYLVVEKIEANEGITNKTHEEFGVVPPFAIPELN